MVPGENDGEVEKPGTDDAKCALRNAIKKLEQLEKSRQKDEESVEDIRWELYKLEAALARLRGSAPPHPPGADTKPEQPAPTVQEFRVQGVGNGRAVVTFDNSKQVTLSPALQALIEILAAGEEASPDDLVAWKNFPRLAELLEKRLDRKFNRHAVSQLLWRLRKSLGANKSLIESVPGLGARLRLKRGSPTSVSAG